MKRHASQRPGLDVQSTHRSVIANKLLAALSDNSGNVAIVVNEKELRFLIECIGSSRNRGVGVDRIFYDKFLSDIKSLYESAYGEWKDEGK